MVVLGFDTATRATAVALRVGDGRTWELRDDPAEGEHPGHATRLLDMAHDLLMTADVEWGEIDRIAVGVGPGAFTGLRVGVATARALAQSLDAQLVAVPSPRALAHAALARPPHGRAPDALLATIDARRGEVFAAAYDAGEPAPRELAAPRALAPQDLAEVIAEAERAGGGQGRSWLAVGDGAVRYRELVQRAGADVPADSSPLHRIGAGSVCELAVAAEPTPVDLVMPDYRRRPDAELALARPSSGVAS